MGIACYPDGVTRFDIRQFPGQRPFINKVEVDFTGFFVRRIDERVGALDALAVDLEPDLDELSCLERSQFRVECEAEKLVIPDFFIDDSRFLPVCHCMHLVYQYLQLNLATHAGISTMKKIRGQTPVFSNQQDIVQSLAGG